MSEQGRAWRRMSRGVLVAGLGIFLLLTTAGSLPWAFWVRLLPLWPVLLIALGIRLVFERSRVPAAVLLSPSLVLGVMAWTAYAGAAPEPALEAGVALEASRPEEAEAWTLEGTVVGGRIILGGPPPADGLLLSGRARSGRGDRPDIRPGAGRMPRVRFREAGRERIVRPWRRSSDWRLQVARDLPMAVDLELVATESELDLTEVPVTALDLSGAFNEIDLRLGRPEREVTLRLESAFSSYRLHVPDGVPVSLRSDGLLNLSESGRGGAGPGYRIRLNGAFNRVRIERIGGGS